MNCYVCNNECEPDYKSIIKNIYCLDCRWDLHYSRQWHLRHTTKEEWKNDKRKEMS